MIISASRRTDIPAFYSDWFMNRVRAGYCLVPNPFNRKQVSRVSLRPEDVDAIVFWTKNAAPLIPHLPELDRMGYRYYFQYTLNGYGRELEPHLATLERRMETFRQLSAHVGSKRVIWRYDPIILSNKTGPEFHREIFRNLSESLAGCTERVVISIVDYYQKTERHLAELKEQGWIFEKVAPSNPSVKDLLRSIQLQASHCAMEMQSCAEDVDLTELRIRPSKCIDGNLIYELWGLRIQKKDANQRQACGCMLSKDIGISDTCLHGCRYCYATRNPSLAARRFEQHDPSGPALLTLQPV